MNRLVFTGRGGGPSIGCGTGTISGFCGVCEPDQAGTRTGFEATEARLTGYRAGDAVGFMKKRGLKFLSPDNVLAPLQAASSAWRIAMAKSWAQGAVDRG
jgi:hypothetical protein